MTLSYKRFLPLLILLATITIISLWVNIRETDTKLQVSGTIEASKLEIIFEVGGEIADVFVTQGDRVQTGDGLIKLEDQLLKAQKEQAKDQLAQALADYQLVAAQPLDETRQAAIAAAELELIQARLNLQTLFDDSDLIRAKALKSIEMGEDALEDLLNHNLQSAISYEKIAAAEKELENETRQVNILTTPPSKQAIDQAFANLLLAENVRDETLEDLDWARRKLQGNLGPKVPKEIKDEYKKNFRQLVKNLEIKLSRDQLAYVHATQEYNDLLTPPDPVDLALAEAQLAKAEAQLEQAQREYERVKDGPSEADIAVLEAHIEAAKRDYEALKDGPDPDDLALAQARIKTAEANLALAQADTIQEQLQVAQAQVEAAEAALGVIQTQLDKLVLTAPVDGVVLFLTVEPGEVAKPGVLALTIGHLDQLTITTYLPEEYYGRINKGDEATIRSDSFPDQIFTSRVIHIAAEDEFLPRNVMNPEGQRQTVFAVTLAVNDPAKVLKLGMLADITFGLP